VLLVVMIIKTFASGVTVDPLLAKNVLWFFGHPVVYLLLFPAVAIYYLVVPRLAGRPLVAGNVVAVAWLVAVIANVVIWAHHVYLDFPDDSIQSVVNTTSQPLTYAIVLPSALSLYSLFFTIHRSQWRWTAASTALFLALVSWLAAGLSGIVNATIAFDAVVHNTLWVVGHFHHMALLNIGLVVIGATYAFLPELLGRPLWSDALGKWHVWLTFLAGSANSGLWLWEGLEGAPRRFSVLPDQFAGVLQQAALPLVVVLGLAQLLFAVNLVQTIRGAEPRPARAPRRWSDAAAEGILVLALLTLLIPAALLGYVVGRERGDDGGVVATTTDRGTTTAGGAEGAAIVADAGCAACHVLEQAGATGQVGPSLDETSLTAEQAAQVIAQGRRAMPSFETQLSAAQIEAVARYVTERD
jgi:heme/copper-type cytochrome/quinol oxidase subunit 1/cytochrome c551/c552